MKFLLSALLLTFAGHASADPLLYSAEEITQEARRLERLTRDHVRGGQFDQRRVRQQIRHLRSAIADYVDQLDDHGGGGGGGGGNGVVVFGTGYGDNATVYNHAQGAFRQIRIFNEGNRTVRLRHVGIKRSPSATEEVYDIGVDIPAGDFHMFYLRGGLHPVHAVRVRTRGDMPSRVIGLR